MEKMDPRLENVSLFVEECYRILDPVLAKARDDMPITCTKGCSYCCYQPVIVNVAEAALIVRWIRENRRMDLWRKITAPRDRGDLDALMDPSVKNVIDYAEKKIPCRFLTPDGFCAVYPVRPLVCRLHMVKSAPEDCRPENRRASVEVAFMINEEGRDLKHYLEESFMRSSSELDLPLAIGFLPVMLLYVANGVASLPGTPGGAFEPLLSKHQLSVMAMARCGAVEAGLEAKVENPDGRYEPSDIELEQFRKEVNVGEAERPERAGGTDDDVGCDGRAAREAGEAGDRQARERGVSDQGGEGGRRDPALDPEGPGYLEENR